MSPRSSSPFLFALVVAALALLAIVPRVHAAVDIAKAETYAQKEQYCRDNQYSCSVFCAGKTDVNTCEASTLSWKCECSDGRQTTVTIYQFPIEIRQCQAEQEQCVRDCLKANPADDTCTAKCKNLMQCGTAASAQAKTFVVKNTVEGKGEQSAAASNSGSSMFFVVLGAFGYFLGSSIAAMF